MSESAQEKMARTVQEQQAQWSAFAAKALDSSMKLFELNLKMAKQSLEDTSQSARHVLSVKSPEDIFKIDQALLQERLNQALSYANEIGAITSAFTTELSQAAQHQLNKTYEKAGKLAEEVSHQSPAPKLFPNLNEAQHGYDQWLDAGKKMVEAFGHGLPAPSFDPAQTKKPTKPAAKSSNGSRARAR
jgi:phasin family protein